MAEKKADVSSFDLPNMKKKMKRWRPMFVASGMTLKH